jgi:hypothetical protein
MLCIYVKEDFISFFFIFVESYSNSLTYTNALISREFKVVIIVKELEKCSTTIIITN